MMTAEEAYKATQDAQQLYDVNNDILIATKAGRYLTYYNDLRPGVAAELEDLGYTLSRDDGSTKTMINWALTKTNEQP